MSRHRHGDLRTALIDAALQALDEEGALPSWRALARACGVSQTAPYRYFDSLEALQAAVAAQGFRRISEYIEAALAGIADPYEQLAEGIRAYVRFGMAHRSWYTLMFGHVVDRQRFPETAEAGEAAFATLVRIVAATGVADPYAEAYALWAAHHGLVDLLRTRPEPSNPGMSDEELTARIVAMSVGYLRRASSR